MIVDDARVEPGAKVGQSTRVWHLAHVRDGAVVGANCVVGASAYIDADVIVGNNCKIQNAAQIFTPASLGDGVFIGPGAILTNDKAPRAVNPDGSQKAVSDWTATGVVVRTGASIGAAATIVAGVTIGRWAMIAAGAVVTRDVLDHELVAGVPARNLGWVGHDGQRLEPEGGRWVSAAGTLFALEETGLVEVPR